MFKKGQVLVLTVKDNGDVTNHYDNIVVQYDDGLLKVRDSDGDEIVYNVHSSAFIKATPQK